jgi:LysM repeat protein
MSKYHVAAVLAALAAGAVSVNAASAQTESASGPVAVETISAPAGGSRLEARWRAPFAVESSGSVPAREPRVTAVRPEPVSPPPAAAVESAPEKEKAGPAPEKKEAPAGARTHVVARGDTLYGIARRYGVSAQKLREVNRLESETVKLGQKLVIPGA